MKRFIVKENDDYVVDSFDSLIKIANERYESTKLSDYLYFTKLKLANEDISEEDKAEIESKSDFYQKYTDKVDVDANGTLGKVLSFFDNVLDGNEKLVSKNEDLKEKVNRLNSVPDTSDREFSVKKIKYLYVNGKGVSSYNDLIDKVVDLTEYGEWLSSTYQDKVSDIAVGFIKIMRDKKYNKFFSKGKVVEAFLGVAEEKEFPILPNSNKTSHEKLFKVYQKDVLGNMYFKTSVLDFELLNDTKPWQRLSLFNNQGLTIEESKVDREEGIFKLPVPNKKEIEHLLTINSELLAMCQTLSKDVKNKSNLEVLSKLNASFLNFYDVLANLVPGSLLRYNLTSTRRSLTGFNAAYHRWTWGAYSAYLKNAYHVSRDIIRLVNATIDKY